MAGWLLHWYALSSDCCRRATAPCRQLWFVDAVQMGLQTTTTYIMAYGVAIMASGAAVVPALLRTLGSRGFTTFSNFTVSRD